MKKLALSLAVLFAVGMVSCGGNKDNNAGDTAVEVGVVDEVITTDTTGALDTTNVEAVGATETTTEAPADKKDAKEDKKDDAAKTDAPAEGETPAPEAGK